MGKTLRIWFESFFHCATIGIMTMCGNRPDSVSPKTPPVRTTDQSSKVSVGTAIVDTRTLLSFVISLTTLSCRPAHLFKGIESERSYQTAKKQGTTWTFPLFKSTLLSLVSFESLDVLIYYFYLLRILDSGGGFMERLEHQGHGRSQFAPQRLFGDCRTRQSVGRQKGHQNKERNWQCLFWEKK